VGSGKIDKWLLLFQHSNNFVLKLTDAKFQRSLLTKFRVPIHTNAHAKSMIKSIIMQNQRKIN